ncbi:C39 family peptidase [Adlercreutzia caecimuris]|uniref:Peptidase C39-like domain-containing protein n=3 Tax=Adlercreutzia caecimuris TaxID=671266 RepID=R9L2J0_9ACTN|nr:C39 family peptidase [Adlercreutzia caecimuris]EOS49972.1 hypothetical protein C811_02437 [Adlercreutzia caecimuris B7]MCR2037641.1 C39 family peptidase [Adlercreutzia caecimuris]THG37940.1 hypothetical protein E5986_03510 [Adlercreutzia caecimuris]
MDSAPCYEDAARPASCASRHAENPYGREAWVRSRAAKAPRPAPSRRRASGSLSRGVGAPAPAPAVRDGLRLVPLVGALCLAVFLLIAAFQLVGIYAGDEPAVGAAVPGPAVSDEGAAAASTPVDQWRAGEIPFLYQIDPRYSAAPYAGANVGESGCGPTSLAMVYIALTGKTDRDPAAMAAFSEEGGYVEDGLTAWRLMSEGAAELGLSSHEVPADESRIVAELEAGHPVICSVRPGDFTDTGHFIVVAGVADDGNLVIHDPNSPANSARTWDVQRVLSQCANLWAFERA